MADQDSSIMSFLNFLNKKLPSNEQFIDKVKGIFSSPTPQQEAIPEAPELRPQVGLLHLPNEAYDMVQSMLDEERKKKLFPNYKSQGVIDPRNVKPR